jgi:hypothetical protein
MVVTLETTEREIQFKLASEDHIVITERLEDEISVITLSREEVETLVLSLENLRKYQVKPIKQVM